MSTIDSTTTTRRDREAGFTRHSFKRDELTFSYLDTGGPREAPVLLALHAHWMEGITFAVLAGALAPEWRVVALDQRGHGHSDHAKSYAVEEYLGDTVALLDHLAIERVVVVGNSLGGLNAYVLAARHAERVRGMIIEDVGAVLDVGTDFTLEWAGTYPTREALAEKVGPRLMPYLEETVRETNDGFRLAFDPRDTVQSTKQTAGDHWADWLASKCPALVLRGSDSRVTKHEPLLEMATRRPNTKFTELSGGHVLHIDNPGGFLRAVKHFIAELPQR